MSNGEKHIKDKAKEEAYQKGKTRREQIQEDPEHSGGPRDDGYQYMTPEEKEAYRQGFGEDPS